MRDMHKECSFLLSGLLAQLPSSQWKKKEVVQVQCSVNHADTRYVSLFSCAESASSVSESDDDEPDMNSATLSELQKAAGSLGGAGGVTDPLSKAKQSRGEKKARKVCDNDPSPQVVSTKIGPRARWKSVPWNDT